MIFDTHAHYDDEAFDEDRDTLLSSMRENGIDYIVNIGASIETTKKTIELTKQYDFVYGAAGVHPTETAELTDEKIDWLKSVAQNDKIVAIGEIGLDYYYKEPEPAVQRKWFEAQMELAREVKLPVIIHSRDAANETVTMMTAMKAGEIGGVIHCFSYSPEIARDFLNMGFYLGIGGVITFSNAKKLKEVVEYAPLDRILLETDCPYLSPTPNRGKRNSSLNLPFVVEEIARLKKEDPARIIDITAENAKRMYRIQ